MDIGWNFRREHLRLQQRSHYVITDGGDQPNVVPRNASVWYYFRETDYAHIKEMWEIGDQMAQGAALMTDTDVDVARARHRLAAALEQAGRRDDVRQHQGGRPAAVGRGRPDAGARRCRRSSSSPENGLADRSSAAARRRRPPRTNTAAARTTSATSRGTCRP